MFAVERLRRHGHGKEAQPSGVVLRHGQFPLRFLLDDVAAGKDVRAPVLGEFVEGLGIDLADLLVPARQVIDEALAGAGPPGSDALRRLLGGFTGGSNVASRPFESTA